MPMRWLMDVKSLWPLFTFASGNLRMIAKMSVSPMQSRIRQQRCDMLHLKPSVTPIRKRNREATTPLLCSEQETPQLVTPGPTHVEALQSPSKDRIGYRDLGVCAAELRPSSTLTTGQCFHWKAVDKSQSTPSPVAKRKRESAWGTHDATEWVGVLRSSETSQSIVVKILEKSDATLYQTLNAPDNLDVHAFLWSYFQLNHSLGELYSQWSKQCDRLEVIASCIPGVRIIDQDPWECLVSFICSSNNNIPRITKMLNAIRSQYGTELVRIHDEAFYSFPSLQELRERATEGSLRDICGLGYRARYLVNTMELLHSLGGEAYLHSLRLEQDPNKVQEKLLQFSGVGRKVADCVALFSLRQVNSIPVDVHVWNIARRDYDVGGQLQNVASLTPTVYRQVGDLFRSRFVHKSGWAHSLLFVAELPSFRSVLPPDIVDDMEKFREEERSRKKGLKR